MTTERLSKREVEVGNFHGLGRMNSNITSQVGFDASRQTFINEDPHVYPYSEGDIELIDRVEYDIWFGKI